MEKHILDVDNLSYYSRIGSGIKKRKGLVRLLAYLFKVNKLIPQNIFLPFLGELYLASIRFKYRNTRKSYRDKKDLLVNLGCGAVNKNGWINVDINELPGVNCVYDCRKDLPFQNNSVKGIFCEHLLEHLDYKEELPCFLSECYRVLTVGGVIRIIVPDAEKYLRAYCKEGWEDLNALRQLNSDHADPNCNWKYATKLELINEIFRQGLSHKYAYDYATLEFLLYRYGFSKVMRQDFGKSLDMQLCLDQLKRASESLYVEAVK